MKKYKTYLFDLDGTLLDTNELIYQSFLNTCKVHGNYTITREQVNSHIGVPLIDQLKLNLEGKTDTELIQIIKDHQEYQKTIYKQTLTIFPGVLEGLKLLSSRQVNIGIVSSRTRPSLDCYLKHTGLFDYFSVICTPERTKNHKPHPEPVLWALEEFRAHKESTLFIGDATFDIESGNAAGVDTAFVTWGHNKVSDLKTKPTYVIDSFDTLF